MNHKYIFDPIWFQENQQKLLSFVNSFFGKKIFKTIEKKVHSIGPNYIEYKNEDGSFTREFQQDNHYSKTLFKAFYPLWWIFHQWDIFIANRFFPKLNLGFDTLTVYPDVASGSVTVDGYTLGTNASYATARATAISADMTDVVMYAHNSFSAGSYFVGRSFINFDTSSLTLNATIVSAVINLVANSTVGFNTDLDTLRIVTAATTNNNSLVVADHSLTTTTLASYTEVLYSSSSWDSTTRVPFTLNDYGIINISKNGISKFALRSKNEMMNITPTGLTFIQVISSDSGDVAKKPQLIVTYTLPTAAAAPIISNEMPLANSDGQKVALLNGSRMYFGSGINPSTGYLNDGFNWKRSTTLNSNSWRAVDISADGKKYIMSTINPTGFIPPGGRLYTFNGTTLTEQRPNGDSNFFWYGVGISADGTKYIACAGNGRLWTYNGVSWSEQRPAGDQNQAWERVGISADGTRYIASVTSGRLWVYNGKEWTEHRPDNIDDLRSWRPVAISADGTKFLAGITGGPLFYFDGYKWIKQTPAGDRNMDWYSVAMNADGTRFIVATNNNGGNPGRIYTFDGNHWAEQQPAGNVDACWSTVSISNDGTEYLATQSTGYAYKYDNSRWYVLNPRNTKAVLDTVLPTISDSTSSGGNTGVESIVEDYVKLDYTMSVAADSYLYRTITGLSSVSHATPDYYLEYDVYWDTPNAKLGVDILCSDLTTTLRNSGATDQNGISAHPDADINTYAYGKWYHRKISLTPLLGQTLSYLNLGCEYNSGGVVTGRIRNLMITRFGNYIGSNFIFAVANNYGDWYGAINQYSQPTYKPVSKKEFIYQIFDGRTYKGSWSKEVLSVPTFRTVINGGASDLIIRLDRDFDNFGEDIDVKLNNKVDVYCYDVDAPDGVIIYSGFISGYRPILDGSKEYLEVTVLPYISQFSKTIYEGDGRSTQVSHNSMEPAAIFASVLTSYRAQGGVIDYNLSTIDSTGSKVSYNFNASTIKEAVDATIGLTPDDWYWRIDPDNKFYLKKSNLTVNDHTFVIGKHVSKMEVWRRSEDILNRVYFIGGDTGGGTILYRVYENTSSIATYGLHAEKMVDQRVTQTATSDIMALREINKRKTPEIRTSITILDNNGNNSNIGYDIESIKPGQTLNILNLKQGVKTQSMWDEMFWDEDVWDQTLAYSAVDTIQIQAVTYYPNHLVIEASSRSPIIAKRIEDIKRNLEKTQAQSIPSTPTIVS